MPTVSELLSIQKNSNYSMLLDSGNSRNVENTSQSQESKQAFNHSRYDIFCSKPCLTLTKHHSESADIEFNKLSQSLNEVKIDLTESNVLKQMRDILKQVSHISENTKNNAPIDQKDPELPFSELPFNGGWLGYFSYDFGKNFELSELNKESQMDVPLCRFGLYRWALISDHEMKTTRLYNFGLSSKEWQNIKQLFHNEQIKTDTTTCQFELEAPFSPNIDYKTYQNSFNKIQDNIIVGNCYQINYAQQFSATFKGSSFQAYQQLSKVNKSPFSAYLNFGDFQVLSLSPERFIQVKNKKVLTQPIKGTAPRSKVEKIDKQNAQDLLSSEKDRSENLMIVDLLRNDLSKTADTASVTVPELFGLYSFESVHHLISTVTSKLAPQYDMFDILQTCLPGGSITGAPKISAMKIIDELENFKRGIYCGVIGYLDFNGNMDTNICIRTLLAKNNKLTCCAGGGIVFDSTVESEYQETFHKISKIIPILEDLFLDNKSDRNNHG